MSVTLSELYQQTGTKLGVIGAAESLAAEDGALIAAKYVGLHEQLLSEGLTTWSADDAVPDWAAPIMVDMLSSLLVDDFGLEDPRRSIIRLEGALGNAPVSPAERKLRRQLALPYVSNPIPAEQF
jgi:hypothetical protein